MHVNLFIYSEKIPKQYFAKGFSLTILTIVYCMEHNITTMLPKDLRPKSMRIACTNSKQKHDP